MADEDDVANSPRRAALVRATDAIALHRDTIQRGQEGQSVPDSLFSSCSVDLSYLNLSSLPEELVDIIREEVNVLRIDHNVLTTLAALGPRLPELSRLRYLSLRHNKLPEFPRELLDLTNLEVLDLKDNGLTALPEDLSRLSRLKKLTIKENKITSLPTCIASMHTLSMLSAADNPITFPPPDKWLIHSPTPKSDASSGTADQQSTIRLKKFMQEYLKGERLRVETDSERQSESNTETTPKPARRQTSGRFPIRPSTSSIDISAMMGPGSPRLPSKPPPLPILKHTRVPTGPRSAALRPSIAPFPSANSERNRSNSESQTFTTIRERRRGVIGAKAGSDQARLDSRKLDHRLSHTRGISVPSSLQKGTSAPGLTDDSSPTSPVDMEPARGVFVSRLSSLPERKRKSRFCDPRIELAHSVHFVLSQLRFPLTHLKQSIREGPGKGTLFERAFHGVYGNLKELQRRLRNTETDSEDIEDDEAPDVLQTIFDSCRMCLKSFESLLETLQQHVGIVIQQADPSYVRSLMLLLYAGLVELRNANHKMPVRQESTSSRQILSVSDESNKLSTDSPESRQGHSRGLSTALSADTAGSDRPLTSLRVRDKSSKSQVRRGLGTKPKPLALHGRGPSGSLASLNGFPLRGYEAYNPNLSSEPPALSRSTTLVSTDFEEHDDDRAFHAIWQNLQNACEHALAALPRCEMELNRSRRRGLTNYEAGILDDVSAKCGLTLRSAKALKKRLASVAGNPRHRDSADFWQLCLSLTSAQTAFVQALKISIYKGLVPNAVKDGVRPVHSAIKAAGASIASSPWGHYTAAASRKGSATALQDGFVSPQSALPTQQFPIPTIATVAPQAYNFSPIGMSQPLSTVVCPTPQVSSVLKSLPPPLGLVTNGSVPPPNPHDPQSAVSSVGAGSGIQSGSATPLPATPLTASLGPAAAATLPTVAKPALGVPGGLNNVGVSINGLGSPLHSMGMSSPNLQSLANGEGTMRHLQRSASTRRPSAT